MATITRKTPTHIFVVENQRLYVNMLDYIFSKDFSHRFVNFKSGEECLENLHLNPDVIILDQSLPGISGMETLKQIRQEHPHIYVLVLISDKDEILPSELFEAGADDYIFKETLHEDEVIEKVENFLNRENLSRSFSPRYAPRSMKQVYYVILALAAISAGLYYYQ